MLGLGGLSDSKEFRGLGTWESGLKYIRPIVKQCHIYSVDLLCELGTFWRVIFVLAVLLFGWPASKPMLIHTLWIMKHIPNNLDYIFSPILCPCAFYQNNLADRINKKISFADNLLLSSRSNNLGWHQKDYIGFRQPFKNAKCLLAFSSEVCKIS